MNADLTKLKPTVTCEQGRHPPQHGQQTTPDELTDQDLHNLVGGTDSPGSPITITWDRTVGQSG